jgi:hypothetical protein
LFTHLTSYNRSLSGWPHLIGDGLSILQYEDDTILLYGSWLEKDI